MPDRADTATGMGRVLIAVYAVFTVAAGARAGTQIATRFAEAPLAYLLSGLAAVVYAVATVGLSRAGPPWRTVAWCACGTELAGVLVIGTASLVDTTAFGDQSVWSTYGQGYGFVPLVLPVLGLAWLRHTGRVTRVPSPGTSDPA